MVDFYKMLDSDTRSRLDKFHKDQESIKCISDEEFGAKLIHYYHNMEPSRFGRGAPVYDGQMYFLLIPEMIRRIYKGNPPKECPCPGCACSDWR